MKLSIDAFKAWENKCITLLGMSGVGKTRLANLLMNGHWFHYSGDYRIGTRYLDEAILDNIKLQAMQVPFLRELLRSDSIYICNNISVHNLNPVASFLGKLGSEIQGGLGLEEFKYRQELHKQAEIAAMNDVPEFIAKAQSIYGYQHFINDAGGSMCELEDPTIIELLAKHTLILYIRATSQDETALIARAQSDPKPMYYRESFLDEKLHDYLQQNNINQISDVAPDDFVSWVFPHLFRARIPRYTKIADQYGYTITTDELAQVTDENSFIALVEKALIRQA